MAAETDAARFSIRGGHSRRDSNGETESPTPIVRTHISDDRMPNRCRYQARPSCL